MQPIFLLFLHFALSNSLNLSGDSSTTIPNLTSQVNQIPGGFFPVEKPDTLKPQVSQAIMTTEKIERSTKRHQLLKIKQAVSQVVAGTNYKAVVTVGEVGADGQVNVNGQYGLCYFEMFLPLGENQVEVSDHKCVKINKSEA